MPHRCAFGCKATDVVMHMFPNPKKFPERFKAWVSLVGGDLQTLPDEEIYNKKRICDIHFKDNHRNRFKRLSALAVPSLFLPCISDSVGDSVAYDRPAGSQAVTAAVMDTSDSVGDSVTYDRPAGSHAVTVAVMDTSDSVGDSVTYDRPAGSQAVTSAVIDTFDCVGDSVTFDRSTGSHAVTTAVIDQNDKAVADLLVEHNYSAASKLTRKRLAKGSFGRTSFAIYTQPLRKKVRKLQNEISRLRKKGKSFKDRLSNATTLSTNVEFQKLVQSMTKPAQLFLNMQKQTGKNPKGRRFSIEEKILSLTLYKRSPKCYSLLNKYFSLPSNRTMKRLMSQIKLGPGINNVIFEKIKKGIINKDIHL